MEINTTLSLLILSFITAILYILKLSHNPTKHKLPPGPKPWPIIGNIHQLGNKPHISLAKLSKIYGPVMTLKLGTMTTIVISSPGIAKEMFVKHDLAFSSRKIPDAVTITNHHKYSVVWLPVSPQWRDLRKIITIQLFTNHRLNNTEALRTKKVAELVAHARRCCDKGLFVDIGKAAFTTSLNLLSNTFFSSDLASHDSSQSREFKDLVWGMMMLGGAPNVSDFFPVVKHLDLQGVWRRTAALFEKLMMVFERIIEQRLSDPTAAKDDVLGVLLELVRENELSLDHVRHLLADLFMAGTDTTSSTLEWAMTELLCNPEKMTKAQNELDQVIGKHGLVTESDISKLPYIQSVVKETLRLHPPAPFLLPHTAEKDVELCDYLVPKNAQIWVNVWSIGRDPSVWPNPHRFLPERFLKSEVDAKGTHFGLIPFGGGRRICPGMPLAHRMLHLMLATLLHSFNWKHAHGLKPRDIDMEEKFGITLQKVHPLEAIPMNR